MMKNKKYSSNMVFSVFFAGGMVLFCLFQLVMGVITFASSASGKLKQQQLTVDDFTLVGIEYVDAYTIINETEDPQMIKEVEGPVKNVWIKSSFSYDPGEVVLFYTTKPGEEYSGKKMIPATIIEDYFYFPLPAGKIESIRIDTGGFPSITVQFEEICFNRFISPVQYSPLDGPAILKAVLGAFFLGIAAAAAWAWIIKRKGNEKI